MGQPVGRPIDPAALRLLVLAAWRGDDDESHDGAHCHSPNQCLFRRGRPGPDGRTPARRNAMINYRRRYIDPRDQYRRWIDPRMHTLRITDVTSYLLQRGWTPLPPDRPGFLVFQEPSSSRDEHE